MRPGPNVKNVMDDRSYEPPEQPVPVFTRKTAGKTVVEEPRDDETDLMELAHIAACVLWIDT